MNLINSILEKFKKSPIVLLFWYIGGRKIPPPHIYKQKQVSSYAKKFNINILYESGTFKGDMVFGMKDKFQNITTVELSDFFFNLAKKRFKKNKHIHLVKGDSKKVIKKFMKSLREPCIFWLDGHYSFGDTAKGKLNTPILDELNSILKHKNKSHVILIDDARHFEGEDDYPKINELEEILKNSNYNMEVKNDVIRITP